MHPIGESIHILHVDDEPDFAEMTATFVEREDDRFRVDTAESPSNGLKLLAETNFDCVISDYDMPNTTGIEFLKSVRPDFPNLPFILFTGKGSEEIASDAISAGVTDYLQKESGSDQYAILANRIANAVESHRNKRQAKQTRKQLQAISEHSADAIVTIDSNSRIHFVNPAVEELFGYTPAELQGEPLTTIMPERYHESHFTALCQYLETGERTMNWSNVEFWGQHKDGNEIPISVSYGEFDLDGTQRFIGIMRDISERGRMEAKLREREEQIRQHRSNLRMYERAVEGSTDLLAAIDSEYNFLFANKRYQNYHDLSQDDVDKRPLPEVVGELWENKVCENVDKALGGDTVRYEMERTGPDGDLRTLDIHYYPLQDEEGSITGAVAAMRDVTEHKKYDQERDLRFFSEVVGTIGVGVGVYGEDGRFEYVNEAYAELLGTDKGTLEDKAVWDINPEVNSDRFDDYWASFEEGETRASETVHRFDGTEVPVQTVTTYKQINDTWFHFGTIQDISERKEQEERFQAFVEQSNDILAILNSDGTFQYQSPSAERILGYEPDEMVGENAFDFIHPNDREGVREQFEQSFAEPDATPKSEYRFQHADGSWRWLESRGNNQFANPAIEGFVVNSRDITERKEHERQLADLHDVTREMVQATEEQEVCEIAVRAAENILEFPITGIWLRDESGDRLEPRAKTATSKELFGDHPVFTDENSLSWQAYTSGESLVFDDLQEESGVYNPDSQVRSELITPLGIYGVMNLGATYPDAFDDNDILLAKLLAANVQAALGRAERERALERQTDQMEFFNSILRHDVLNAVTVIKSRAEFLTDDLEGEQLRDAETIVAWCKDVRDIVQQVRTVLETLTGEGDPQLNPVELGAELRAEVHRVQSTYPSVTVNITVPDDVKVIANDLLGDVLGNIVTNAIEHNETDGLTVSITVEKQGELAVIRIADNGQGVSDDRKEAIFRRDETGHAKSTGSGFGLFFVDVMVKESNGDVWVEDNVEGGATFVVEIPLAEQSTTT